MTYTRYKGRCRHLLPKSGELVNRAFLYLAVFGESLHKQFNYCTDIYCTYGLQVLKFHYTKHSTTQTLQYAKQENENKRDYEQCVYEVEHSSFTLVLMSLKIGPGKASTTCYECLASLIVEMHDHLYSKVMDWLRCRSSFRCIR